MSAADPDERLEELFRSHYDEVLAYCTRRIGSNDADDVAAEIFAVAWRRIDEIRWETARPWLYGIARRVIANRWRSVHRHSRLAKKIAGLAQTSVSAPDVYIVRRAEDKEVVAALQKLKPSDQEVLMLAAWEELTAPEIAHAMSISTSAAEQRLHRAKHRFANVFDPPMPSPFPPRAEEEGGGR